MGLTPDAFLTGRELFAIAKALSPPEFVEEMQEELNKMRRLYKNE